LGAGVSQRHLARVTGMSQSKISRFERDEQSDLTVVDAALIAAALGQRLSIKTYPVGSLARCCPATPPGVTPA
jgi:transcriptional regulator with XRE-family HTH domain